MLQFIIFFLEKFRIKKLKIEKNFNFLNLVNFCLKLKKYRKFYLRLLNFSILNHYKI